MSAVQAWQVARANWRALGRESWRRSGDDSILHAAAGVAFFGFLALVPLLGATVLTFGLIADPITIGARITEMTRMLPPDAASVIGAQIESIVKGADDKKGWGVALAIALALFSARGGAGALMTGLNIAYREKETRGFVRRNIVAIFITVCAVAMAMVAIGALSLIAYARVALGAGAAVVFLLNVAGYAIAVLLLAAGAAGLYWIGPDRTGRAYVWLTPGSVVAALAWLVGTLGFQWYVTSLGNYNATYGALGGLIVLLTWLWLSAVVVLLGGQVNSELEAMTDVAAGDAPAPPAA